MDEPGDGPKEHGLAGPVDAQKPVDAPAPKLKGNMVQDRSSSYDLGRIPYRYDI